MICPKCKSENQFGIFCSECGNRLKEKCPECGELEPIGRKVCETKINDIKNEAKSYCNKRVMSRGRVLLISFGAMLALYGIVIYFLVHVIARESALSVLFFSPPVIFVMLLFFLDEIRNIKKEKKRQEFLQEHPDYAEILRKAEE